MGIACMLGRATRIISFCMALALALAGCGGGGGGSVSSVAAWMAPMYRMNEDLSFLQIPPAALTQLENQTVRQVARLSVGGGGLRFRLSNAQGKNDVVIDRASVARALQGGTIDASTSVTLSFDGRPGVRLAAGSEIWSDTVAFVSAAQQDVAVSIYVGGKTAVETGHRLSGVASYVSQGDCTTAASFSSSAQSVNSYIWLSAIDVVTEVPTKVVVAFGDSITASGLSTVSYPALLSARAALANTDLRQISVVNAGVGGGRWLHHRFGVRGVDRFPHDVIASNGVTHVVILMGINDIGFGALWLPEEEVSAEQLIGAIDEVIQIAIANGVKPILGTLTPFQGYAYYSEQGEKTRQTVNDWIRANRTATAIVDFDTALRDPQNPRRLASAYDSGDHLHPSAAGREAMQRLFDLASIQ